MVSQISAEKNSPEDADLRQGRRLRQALGQLDAVEQGALDQNAGHPGNHVIKKNNFKKAIKALPSFFFKDLPPNIYLGRIRSLDPRAGLPDGLFLNQK
jgi:hypothetical protein